MQPGELKYYIIGGLLVIAAWLTLWHGFQTNKIQPLDEAGKSLMSEVMKMKDSTR